MDLKEDLIRAWEKNNSMNLLLLDEISVEGLGSGLNPRGRNVGEQVAHLHNVRIMWLEVAAPDLAGPLSKLPKEVKAGKAELKKSLKASAAAISALLSLSVEKGKVKNFKGSLVDFLSYLIAHEAHHRGQVILHLKQSGYPISKEAGFGLWEWGK